MSLQHASKPHPECKLLTHLSVTTSLGNLKQVLQQITLLLLEELLARRVHVCPDGLVCIEGSNVHLAHLHSSCSHLQAHISSVSLACITCLVMNVSLYIYSATWVTGIG